MSRLSEAQRASAELVATYPAIEGVCLYGSVARGDDQDTSDIDLLVLGNDPLLTSGPLWRSLGVPLQDHVSLAYHCTDSLDDYLNRWSRFSVHLRSEGKILFDRHGLLSAALTVPRHLSTKDELLLQKAHLVCYEHLDRFGGHFLFPLSHLYSIGRTVILALLAEHGLFLFNQGIAFQRFKAIFPDLSSQASIIEQLLPFSRRVHGHVETELPFDDRNSVTEVANATEAIRRLLSVSVHASDLSN